MERTNAAGEPIEFPPDYLAIETADGVVLDRTFVERTEQTRRSAFGGAAGGRR